MKTIYDNILWKVISSYGFVLDIGKFKYLKRYLIYNLKLYSNFSIGRLLNIYYLTKY
jgi:hypothetical protein